MSKFEIYKSRGGEYKWRLKASNGEIIAVGEGYKSKQNCKNGTDSVKNNAPKAGVGDLTE